MQRSSNKIGALGTALAKAPGRDRQFGKVAHRHRRQRSRDDLKTREGGQSSAVTHSTSGGVEGIELPSTLSLLLRSDLCSARSALRSSPAILRRMSWMFPAEPTAQQTQLAMGAAG